MAGKAAALLSAIFYLLSSVPARADLTAVVTPGYQFPLDGSVAPAYNLLNLLAQPTISIYGTVGGSNTLTPGSVTGVQLAQSVADGVTIGFNGSVSPSLQVLAAGLSGPGLTNVGTSGLELNLGPSLTFTAHTNAVPGTNYLVQTNWTVGISTNWTYAQVWTPWLIYSLPTNGWATNGAGVWTNPANAWGYTNIVPITNLLVGGNPAWTLTATDTVPVLSQAQGTNPTTATLTAVGQFLAAQNYRAVGTLYFDGAVTNGDTVTGIGLYDTAGSYNLINPAVAVTATNTTLSNFVGQVVAAVNSWPGNFRAQFTTSNTLTLLETTAAWPGSGNKTVVNFASATNLAIYTSTLPITVTGNVNGNVKTNFTNGGYFNGMVYGALQACVTGAGGVPPYSYAWTVAATNATHVYNFYGVGVTNTTGGFANGVYMNANTGPNSGVVGDFTFQCVVTDSLGNKETNNFLFTFTTL